MQTNTATRTMEDPARAAAAADALDALKASKPLAAVPEAALLRLAEQGVRHDLAGGEGLEIDGDAAVLAVTGRVRVIEGGRFHDVEPGQILFFDEIVAGRGAPAAAGTALEAAAIIVLPAAAVEEMLTGAAAGAAVARYFARRLTAGGAAASSPSHRLYGQLVMIARPNGGDGNWRIAKMPRHRELAREAGLSEEAAADAIAHLISTGVARRNYPGLDILNYDALRRLASS